MRWISFDDTEAGVLAIGRIPVGIIAIGGMPVGVVAIGMASAGGVSLSCGGGAGLVVITCGIGAGGLAWGVGLGIGLKSTFVGLGLSVLETSQRVVESKPAPSRFDRRVENDAVELRRLTDGELSQGWVLLEAVRAPYQPWTLVVADEPLELADAHLGRQLEQLTEQDPRVLAHLVAEERIDASVPEAGYRSAQPTTRVLRCDNLVAGGKEPGPVSEMAVDRLDWIGALWKGSLLLAAMALAIWIVKGRLEDLELDRKAEVAFEARVLRAAGQAPAAGQSCTIRAWLRTDGAARRKAAAEVSCGGAVLYSRTEDRAATFYEVPSPGGRGGLRYRLSYVDEGERPDSEDSGSPSLVLDTGAGRAVVESWDDPAYRVELDVDQLSAERTGAALLLATRPQ